MRNITAYKLFKLHSDGSLGSLFINCRDKIETGKWLNAEFHPRKGFKERIGWHCVPRKFAPHLSKRGRVWKKIKIANYKEITKPKNQGGKWYIAGKMKVLNEN